MAKSQMLTMNIPICIGDPLRLTNRSDQDISSEFFGPTGNLIGLTISSSGTTKTSDNRTVEVSLHFVTDDVAASVARLMKAINDYRFPSGTRVFRMWRGSDFTVQTEHVYEHP
jgi:hypothetical protein